MKLIKISIQSDNILTIIKHINNYHLEYYDLVETSHKVYLKINNNDLKHYKSLFNNSAIEVIKICGLKGVISYLRYNWLKILILFLFIIFFLILSNLIVKIDINVSDNELKKYLQRELIDLDIKPWQFKKSFKELTFIKKQLLINNKERLEWLEIRQIGMKYIIDVNERIITPEVNYNNYCYIIAKKAGLVKSIIYDKGTSLVKVNDLVDKDEILISGDIIKNETVVNKMCAQGKVYAEVWYKVDVTIPLVLEKNNYTGKWRYNLSFQNNNKETLILKKRIKNSEIVKDKSFLINKIGINIIKEQEIVKEKYQITTELGEKMALEKAKNSVTVKLADDDKIIMQKVLKKTINNSTIDLEIFIVTLENIGTKYIVKEE